MVLIGGAPGIGKSTLLLQVLDDLAAQGIKVLYCSSEESVKQTRTKLKRFPLRSGGFPGISSPYLEDVLEAAERERPRVLALDSLQATALQEIPSPPGSILQVREVASRLMKLAKKEEVVVLLVGHVTKEGTIAGPKAVEHLVDVVLYFEQGTEGPFRILRSVKNRFGSTNEIGVFQMTEKGLVEVPNPSGVFLSERPEGVPGTVVMPALEGSRPLLVEVQALVAPSAGGSWKRMAMGIDHYRLQLLVGVIEKKVGLDLSHCDVFVNIVGGLKVFEPAADLAVVAALISSHLERALPADCVVFGEVGLTGEVRGALYAKERLEEAKRLGFSQAIVPKSNAGVSPRGMTVVGIKEVREILRLIGRSL